MEFGKFTPSNLRYNFTDNGIVHNYNKDLQFYILWENGMFKQKEILEKISSSFNIVYCAEVHWSNEKRIENFNRIYSQPIDSQIIRNKYKTIGMGPFLCIVYEDLNPEYKYLRSLGGEVFIGNINAVQMKNELRQMLGENLIHGSSSISEFFQHAILIFHEKKLQSIINRNKWDSEISKLEQDLAGANGWDSFYEMFSIIKYCSDWVVLRNHQYLPDNFWEHDKDIDLMCDDMNNFVAAANATQIENSFSAFKTTVDNKTLILDIRYKGDNYYDPNWQHMMLERKLLYKNTVPYLRDDDYFFSLLYHAKLQKKAVKEEYIKVLLELARKIGLNNLDSTDILDDKESATIINGYLSKQNYFFHMPYDKNVYLNKSVYKYITARPTKVKESIKKRIVHNVARVAPNFVKRLIPTRIKDYLIR